MALGPVGQQIAKKLSSALKPLTLEIIDESHQHHGHVGAHPSGESHFRVRIVAPGFSGKMRVARHRMVNEALAEELHSRVHALVIEAKSPEEDFAFVDLTATDEKLRKLLGLYGLPTDDLSGKRFIGMIRGGELAAAGGLDLVLPYVLLRSVAVNADLRGGGFGRVMVIRLLGEARNTGAKAVFLLTASAQPFFSTLGFENISRDDVPAEIAGTSQFTGSTCSTAQPMRLNFDLGDSAP